MDTNGCIAQKILRELKAKISSQSKKNFVLEKDVRYLDSRIALLIQNRMALEEVPFPAYVLYWLRLTTPRSKMKLRTIWTKPLSYKKGSFQMTRRHKNTETCYSFSSLSRGTLPTYAA